MTQQLRELARTFRLINATCHFRNTWLDVRDCYGSKCHGHVHKTATNTPHKRICVVMSVVALEHPWTIIASTHLNQ